MPTLPRNATLAEALVAADLISEEEGTNYEVLEPRAGRTRFELRWLPKLGEGVAYSIGSDRYYDGKITALTKATFTTERGTKYRWSSTRRAWNLQGCKYTRAFKGDESSAHRDPSF